MANKKASKNDKAILEKVLASMPISKVSHKKVKDRVGNTAPKNSKTMSSLKKAMNNRG